MRDPTASLPIRLLSGCLIASLFVPLAWTYLRTERRASVPPPGAMSVQIVAPSEHATPSTSLPNIFAPSAPAFAEDPDSAPQRPPPLELTTGPLAWELKLAAAAARGRDAAGTAREIFSLLPSLPEEALTTAAEQAVERLPDASYATVAQPVLIHQQTHALVLSVLFADLMERPDAITLPALLSIARNPAHPFAPAAYDNLRLLIGPDFGPDQTKWDDAVQRTLVRKQR